MPEKKNQIYEGKAKKVYATENPEELIVSYKDDATAFNGLKKGQIVGKGSINNRVTNFFMRRLEKEGIPTHFLKELNQTETLVRRVKIVPLEVLIRNVAAGSLSTRLGLPEGQKLPFTVVEFCYKSDELGDPMVNEDHIAVLGAATPEDLRAIREMSLHINRVLSDYLQSVGILLVDFKLEFGKTGDGRLVLADEISPDTCRFWDVGTGKKLDKDRFRRDLGGVEEAYQEIERRLGL